MITSRQSRRGLGGLAVALPLTLAIAAGAAAAPPDHAKYDDRRFRPVSGDVSTPADVR